MPSLSFLSRSDGGVRAWRIGRGLLGSSLVIGIGLAIELGSQFARTLVLARLLGAEEFGLVASIMTLAAVVDMVSFVGIDRFIVYSPAGGDPEALKAAHALTWLRAIAGAAIVVAFALPTADLLGAHAYAASFAAVGLYPLLRAATHLGATQWQRSGRFFPDTAAEAGGAVLGLVTAVVTALTVPGHLDIVWALAAQSAASVLLSHLLARGVPYRIGFDRERMREALRFGLPLLGNGLALAAVYQLDRMVVGAWLGIVAVGIYGLSMTLLLQPISLLLRLVTTALQPRLSEAWHGDRAGAFPRLVRELGRYIAAAGAAGAIVAACLGAPLLRVVFGPGYAASDTFFALLAVVAMLRFCRGAQGVLGLAIGHTADLMVSNIAGTVALPVTIAAFYLDAAPESAAFGLCVGELLSVAVADLRLRQYCGSADRALIGNLAVAAVVPAALAVWVLFVEPTLPIRAMAAGLGLAATACLVLLVPRRSCYRP